MESHVTGSAGQIYECSSLFVVRMLDGKKHVCLWIGKHADPNNDQPKHAHTSAVSNGPPMTRGGSRWKPSLSLFGCCIGSRTHPGS